MISSLSECLSFWPTDFRHVYLIDFLTISMSVYLSECLCVRLLLLLSWHCFLSLKLQGFFFFFSYQKPTDFNRKRLKLYTQKPLYLHLTLNVLDDWYQTIDSMRVSPYYYPTAQSRVQISCDIVRSFGQLVILYCKKTLLYSLCFSRHIRNEQKNLAEQKAVE